MSSSRVKIYWRTHSSLHATLTNELYFAFEEKRKRLRLSKTEVFQKLVTEWLKELD